MGLVCKAPLSEMICTRVNSFSPKPNSTDGGVLLVSGYDGPIVNRYDRGTINPEPD